MTYSLDLKPKAEKDIRALPRAEQERVAEKLRALREDLQGDVKRLTQFVPSYRLRVGDYRVLFEIENDAVVVYRILHRREAYR